METQEPEPEPSTSLLASEQTADIDERINVLNQIFNLSPQARSHEWVEEVARNPVRAFTAQQRFKVSWHHQLGHFGSYVGKMQGTCRVTVIESCAAHVAPGVESTMERQSEKEKLFLTLSRHQNRLFVIEFYTNENLGAYGLYYFAAKLAGTNKRVSESINLSIPEINAKVLSAIHRKVESGESGESGIRGVGSAEIQQELDKALCSESIGGEVDGVEYGSYIFRGSTTLENRP